ncbi:14385_t:CDS:2, partial [Cetraspora pellucida]
MTRNGWYKEKKVEAFLVTIYDELEIDYELDIDYELNGEGLNTKLFQMCWEPYEKEVRYLMILESIVLETFDGDRARPDDKQDEDSYFVEKDNTVLEEERKQSIQIVDNRKKDDIDNPYEKILRPKKKKMLPHLRHFPQVQPRTDLSIKNLTLGDIRRLTTPELRQL